MLRNETNLGWCMERTLQIVDLVSERAREIRHWQYTAWPASGTPPPLSLSQTTCMRTSFLSLDQPCRLFMPGIPDSGRPLVQLFQRMEEYERSLIVVPEESIYGNAKAIAEQV